MDGPSIPAPPPVIWDAALAPLVAHELVGRDAEPVREVPRGQADMLTLGAEPGGGSEEARLVGRLHGGGEKEKTPATG
jgi:hypothetical protein